MTGGCSPSGADGEFRAWTNELTQRRSPRDQGATAASRSQGPPPRDLPEPAGSAAARELSAARAMLRVIPPKTTPWNGQIAHQYMWPSSPCGWNSARWGRWSPLPVTAHAHLQPSEAGQPHLGAQPQQPSRFDLLDAPEVERLADIQPIRVAPARGASPRRPTIRSMMPRTLQASGKEYQPRSPPIPSITRHTASGEACDRRARARRCRGCRLPSRGRSATDRWALPGWPRRTNAWRHSPRGSVAGPVRRRRSKPISPSGGSGTYAAMSCSWHTTSCRSDSTSGRASEPGTGVTRPTHRLDRRGRQYRDRQYEPAR